RAQSPERRRPSPQPRRRRRSPQLLPWRGRTLAAAPQEQADDQTYAERRACDRQRALLPLALHIAVSVVDAVFDGGVCRLVGLFSAFTRLFGELSRSGHSVLRHDD